MLDTWDNKIFMPRFYDCDTICSYDNSGDIKFDVDIEMEQGYWNTSSSRLWTRVRDLMHNDLVEKYNDMRQNGLSYESLMKCFYDEQIAKIPQKYYNMDYDVKYAPFADSYIGMAHGNGYEHLKHWLKRRIQFTDSLFDYAPSYINEVLTIRANTTEDITLEIETYNPTYQHLSWYNGQMDKKKIDGKTSVTFSGRVMAETDQEILIYGGSNIKKIKGISSANPNQMLIGYATRLTELNASNCPLLADINSGGANLSPHTYLNNLNLSNCPQLGGNLRLNNSQLIQDVDISGTIINGLQLPTSVRNLETFKLSEDVANVTLRDAVLLKELNIPTNIEYLSLINVPSLTTITSNASSFEKLNTLIMENPKVNPISNIVEKAPNLQYVRLIGLDIACSVSQMQLLSNLKGLDSFGNEIPINQSVSGKVTLTQCSEELEIQLKEMFPLVEFIITSYAKSYTVTFVDGDGNVLYIAQTLQNDSAIYIGNTPTKTSTKQYNYEWVGWDRPLKPITSDCTLTATFNEILRYYTIRFIYSDTLEVVSEQILAYGETITKPTITNNNYNAWTPIDNIVTGDIDFYTTYIPYPEDLSIFTFNKMTYNGETGYECILEADANVTLPSYLIIPFEYEGLPVLAYGQMYTVSHPEVNEVYFPEVIKFLRPCAFYGFSSITDIYLPNIIKFVSSGQSTTYGSTNQQFSYCSSLKSVKLPKLQELSSSDANKFAFRSCNNLEYVWLGSEDYPFKSWATGSTGSTYAHFYGSTNKLQFINLITENGVESDVTTRYVIYSDIKQKITYSKKPIEVYSDDNFEYCIIENEATITAYKGTATEIEIPSTVKGATITKIGKDVFYNSSVRTEITSVNLPSTVTSLGASCFYSCSNLTEINLPNVTSLGASCFYSCSNLTSINIPKVTSLGNSCFYGCSKLTSIDLPLVTSLDNQCFYNCSNLTEINLPNVTNLGTRCFDGCSKLNSIDSPLVTNLGTSCFYSCSNLTSINIPKVTSLGNSCFYNCTKLTSIDLPLVTSIGEYCFQGCSSLTEINLPNVTSLSRYCFADCDGLTSLDLPNITSLNYYCFGGCENLTEINLPNATSTGNSCFISCTSLTSINLPLATSIGNSCFKNCTSLTEISLPSATSLDYDCFYNCTSLVSIDLPNVTSLEEECFRNCTSLTSIGIPEAISLGENCFYGCTRLRTITLPKVKTLGNYLTNSCPTGITVILGGVGNPITDTSGFAKSSVYAATTTLIIYVTDPSNPPTLTGSPWGATDATITYEQA